MKMKTPAIAVAALVIAWSVQIAPAQIIINETFEGYADTAAMDVNWDLSGTAVGVLVSTNGNPGNSAWFNSTASYAGTVNVWSGPAFSLLPTDSSPVRLTADIYDATGTGSQRQSVGLRNGADPLIELGHDQNQTELYAYRVVNCYGSVSWQPFPGVTRTAGWSRFEGTFGGTYATFTLDIGADGTIDSTVNLVGAASANPFVDIRFGGPSDVSSNQEAWYDNIVLQVIPEPSTFALGLVGGLGLLCMLRRRSA